MKALAISDRLGIARYISQQINYSLLARDAEHELVPVGLDQQVGIMAWSPLQAGLLSGKFRRGGEKPSESRLNTLEVPGNIDPEALDRITDALAEIAAKARRLHRTGGPQLGHSQTPRGHRDHRRAQ